MSGISLKVELNKGRHGIAMQKLAQIAEETEKFLESLAEDLHLNKTEWIADNFENGSLNFEVHYAGSADPAIISQGKKAIAHILDPKTKLEDLDYGISQKTFLHFALMAHPIDIDDSIELGIRNNEFQYEMQSLTKQRALAIEQEANQSSLQYASFQGSINALFKENNSCWLKDQLTGNRIVCQFNSQIYSQIWRLLERRDAIVNVEGWLQIRAGEGRSLKVESIEELPDYKEGDIERFFGCDKSFTGNLTTTEFLEELRGEHSKQ
jgi:hypothetical protein